MIAWPKVSFGSMSGASIRRVLLRVLGLGCATVIWLGAQNETNATKIKKIAVVYRDQHGMHTVSEQEIARIVDLQVNRQPRGIASREAALKALPSLVRADLSLGLDGKLLVELESSRPVLRVMPTGRPGYYLDDRGQGVPLSSGFAWPLPLVLGQVPGHWSQALTAQHNGLALALRAYGFLDQDSLLQDEVTQYLLMGMDSASLSLETRSGQRIWVGTSFDLHHKLQKLAAFYRWAPVDSTPQRFHNINLIFKDQIVCR
ncbi:MAG: cell division protein FtsQ/DivIB [Bacteroidota bacterium]